MMKKLILFIFFGFCSMMTFSQSDVVQFLKGGKNDANALVKAYLNPYAMALGDGLNNGWYNSAATHKLFGFDISVSVSAIQIPQEATTFDLNTIGLTKLTLENPSSHLAPTVAGADVVGPKLIINGPDGKPIGSFSTPKGLGLDLVPVPMAQIGFGLLPHTDIIGRYVPEMKYDNSGDEMKIGFWGVGVKHNFQEWVPIIKSLPFDASVFGSYSEVSAQSEISFDPSDYNDGNVRITFGSNNQMLKFNTKTTKFGLILSKKFSILTIYGGIGQSTSETTIDLLGKYVIETTAQVGGTTNVTKDNLEDPIALSFNSNNICMDAGLRIKLAFFSLFGSVNKAEYTSYNAGLSLGFR
ncbi:MAG TPA: hypothetical protein DCR40_01805 [Prolixibacteraceae bacterium]|nr:hypothetical protein [Prolixibacteraceae bacterium]